MSTMLKALQPLKLDLRPKMIRNTVLVEMQRFIVEKIKEYHGRKRLEFCFDASSTTWTAVHELLSNAELSGKAGQVAQYLVGAKLQLRFPDMPIPNERYSAPDAQTVRLGDFEIGDTAFHVTVSPLQAVYEKCRRNISGGARVYLLVPDKLVVGSRQLAESTVAGKIAVESLESFIANNIEELSGFSKDRLIGGFRRLLDTYNQRVDAIETDKSLMIEIPSTLL